MNNQFVLATAATVLVSLVSAAFAEDGDGQALEHGKRVVLAPPAVELRERLNSRDPNWERLATANATAAISDLLNVRNVDLVVADEPGDCLAERDFTDYCAKAIREQFSADYVLTLDVRDAYWTAGSYATAAGVGVFYTVLAAALPFGLFKYAVSCAVVAPFALAIDGDAKCADNLWHAGKKLVTPKSDSSPPPPKPACASLIDLQTGAIAWQRCTNGGDWRTPKNARTAAAELLQDAPL